MIRTDLQQIGLGELAGGPQTVVLCASARLAAGLRRAHGGAQAASGAASWLALQTATVAQWLDHLASAALLRGEIPPASVPGMFLTWPQERSVWEQAVAADVEATEQGAAELFDREGMALAAMEAESCRLAWRVEVPESLHTEEYRAFLRWQAHVAAACQKEGWSTADDVLAWRIACLARGMSGLPERVGMAGFTTPDPLVSRLLVVLEERGVELFHVNFGRQDATSSAHAIECADAEAECLAVSEWARDSLLANPTARLRIAVAELSIQRRRLAAALEAALHPDAIGAGWAGYERDYAFVAGSLLASESLVAVALRLLQIFAQPRQMAQADFGALLCGMGWSADVAEADGRARLEAALRELLPPEISLERLQRTLNRWQFAGDVPGLRSQLMALSDLLRAAPKRQLPGAWGRTFAEVLTALGWPGQRELLAVEREASALLLEAMSGLSALDAILSRVDVGTALRQLVRQCRDHAFVPARQRPARVEICSLEDAVAEPVDGLWVMGLNEGAWPRAPRPNPLLPADIQRRSGVPAARADSLAAQAEAMQAVWCASAGEVIFSWKAREGERMLRPSPLLAGVARRDPAPEKPQKPLVPPALPRLERLFDAKAPAVSENEKIRGGTWLLQAQAICPAWGFHQYRLGAKTLPVPVFGLDARARGSLVHAALEAFWRGRSWAALKEMSEEFRIEEIGRVVAHALAEFEKRAPDPLPPRLRALESERLAGLIDAWLELEIQRSPFRVAGCEERHTLDIAGLPVRVVVDRIDELDDGRLVILDYKTGKSATAASWAGERISEPQLPIYAALVFPDRELAAVALARVVPASSEAGFVGVADSEEVLPGVKPLDGQRKRYAEDEFPDFASLRRRWAERLTAVAVEVKEGCAAVVFENEKQLEYCEVRPLLRLAERRMQWEEEQ